MRHKAALSSLALIGLAACGISWGIYRNSRFERNFNSIHVGVSRERVLEILGKPSWVESCGKSLDNQLANCSLYIYRDSFAPVIPQYWSVRFDASGSVLETYFYQSP
jgi:hypothetical protein